MNPTLTIIANALRVADHLADRLGSSLPARRDQPIPTQQPDLATATSA